MERGLRRRCRRYFRLYHRHSLIPPACTTDGFLSLGMIAEPKDEGAVPRLNPSTLLVGQARGVDARPAMDERPGMVEIDLPCGTRLRVDAFVNERALRRVLCVLRSL